VRAIVRQSSVSDSSLSLAIVEVRYRVSLGPRLRLEIYRFADTLVLSQICDRCFTCDSSFRFYLARALSLSLSLSR